MAPREATKGKQHNKDSRTECVLSACGRSLANPSFETNDVIRVERVRLLRVAAKADHEFAVESGLAAYAKFKGKLSRAAQKVLP